MKRAEVKDFIKTCCCCSPCEETAIAAALFVRKIIEPKRVNRERSSMRRRKIEQENKVLKAKRERRLRENKRGDQGFEGREGD